MLIKVKLYIYISLLFSPLVIHSQNNNIDSVIDSLYYFNDYDTALKIQLDNLELIKKEKGKNNVNYFLSVAKLTHTYRYLHNYNKVLELQLEMYEIFPAAELSTEIANTYLDLGNQIKSKEYYKISIDNHLNTLDDLKNDNRENHPDYLSKLRKLILLYNSTHDFLKVQELSINSLSLCEKIYGINHPSYSKDLNRLAMSFGESGDHFKALEYHNKCLDLREKIYGNESEYFANSLHNIGFVYNQIGEFYFAIDFYKRSLSLFERLNGNEDRSYLSGLSNLAASYVKLDKYSLALETILIALNLQEKVFGNFDSDYLISLNNLAFIHAYSGNYGLALDVNIKALSLCEKKYGKNHPKYATILQNVAGRYLDLMDYSSALNFLKQSLKIIKNIYGEDHPDYSLALNNLATAYSKVGKKDTAIDLYHQCLSLAEKLYGNQHPDYATVLGNLALSYSSSNEYYKALDFNEQSLNLFDKLYGKNHSAYITQLGNLSDIYCNIGRFEKALSLAKQATELSENLYGKIHPDYINSLNNLAFVYQDLGDYSTTLDLFVEIQDFQLLQLKIYNNELNSSLRTKYYDQLINKFSPIFSFSYMLNDKIKLKNQYNVLCQLKGGELSNANLINSIIYQSNDDELINLHEKWVQINKKIGICFEKTIIEQKKIGLNLDELQNEANELERQLTKISSTTNLNQFDYSFDDIVSILKKDELYIDIIQISSYIPEQDILDTNYNYFAYIIKKQFTEPELVYLGNQSSFDSIYHFYSNYTQERPFQNLFSDEDQYYGNICYENFWAKFEGYLDGISTVYFSPEGVYSKINPNVLYDSSKSVFLIDKYNIEYVSNVKDFVHQKENIQLFDRTDDLHAVLIGNPTFLLEEDEVVLASNQSTTRSINQDELDSLQRGASLLQLPGTQIEIDLISDNLKSKGWEVEVISGEKATETMVKNIEAPKFYILQLMVSFLKIRIF